MFKRKRSVDDFAEEIKAHLELEANELQREGLSKEEARRRAKVEFGNPQAAQERFYLRSRVEWIDNLVRDIRFAFRQLLKNPGFSSAAIAVLALGIGACVAVFAFVDAALIKPLPYADPQRLVHVTESEAAFQKVNLSYLDYVDWKRLNTVLNSMDIFTGWDALLVVINHAFVRKYFPGEDPVGKQIGDPTLSPPSMKQIVGVVEDFKDGALDEEQQLAVYYPFNQNGSSGYILIVRTSQEEHTILPAVTAAIHKLNMDVGVEQGSTMSDQINDSQTAYFHRSTAYLVGGFAALALVLSAVGLYGVIAYSVSQRTREIGVRMALGAQRWSVHRMVLREAAWLTGAGIAIGVVCSLAFGELLRGLLFGVRAWDLPTLATVAIVLGLLALFASYIPAHRAASVNPVAALRAE